MSFRDEDDAIAFFGATRIHDCFIKLSDSQKENVVALRSRFSDESLAATLCAHAKEREVSHTPRYIGAYAGSRPAPTVQELQPEIDAINAEIAAMPKANKWADAIAKTNAKLNSGAL
ncbi:hypothetical protein [Mesorhizobium sp. M8A.F.Ca.ET.181.01.1.1]|uniref:hypothetical protein n=1 Tax=Mesorhizobium sp. M8A.F.Ca.ET.181.01.1.1 TaxID=2563963 RepID=UPI00109349FD|nr:hypothetical protein [Mesorhizobium sp. M8A.F.Ca.ET.181.01.1.1]